jgi:predicted secreted protein
MQIRSVKDSLFVISKKDTVENREYLVAFNNSTKPITTTITSATSTGGWKVLLGSSKVASKNEKVTITVAALSTLVLKANKGIDKTSVKVGKITSEMDFLTGYYETKATITSQDLLRVTFYCRISADQPWVSLGTDTNTPYSVYIDPLDYEGQKIEIRAEAVNSRGVKYGLPSTTITVPAP